MRNNLFENETRPVFHRAGQNRPELHKSSSPNVTSCLTSLLSHAQRKKKCVGNARQGNLDWLSIQMPTCLDAFLLYGIVETFSGFGEKGILEHQLGEKKKKSFSTMEITRAAQRSEMHFVNVEIKVKFIFNINASFFS